MPEHFEDQILKSAMKVLRVDKPSRIILFGSYAWGEATAESDLDLLVLVKTQKRGIQMVNYRNAMGRGAPGVGVDIVVYREDEASEPVPGTALF